MKYTIKVPFGGGTGLFDQIETFLKDNNSPFLVLGINFIFLFFLLLNLK